MAMRRATHRYPDLASFMRDHDAQLKDGYCLLPAEAIKGELANPLKLDLVIPLVGRVGPFEAQVVSRTPDGSAALRLPDFDQLAAKPLRRLRKHIAQVRAYLVESGELVESDAVAAAPAAAADPTELERLRARVAELEAALAEGVPEAAPLAEAPLAEAGGEQEGVQDPSGAAVPDDDPAEPGAADDGPEPTPAPKAPSPCTAVPAEDQPAAPPAEVAAAARARGIPVPDLSGVEPTYSSELTPHAFQQLLVKLAAGRHTGILTMRCRDGRVRYGFWSTGGPVGWRTDPIPEGEVLGVLLLKAGQITKEQLAESLRLMEERGCRQGEAFIEMGVMSFSQLIMVLGKQNDFVLQLALRESGGQLTFHDQEQLPESFLPPPLPVPSLLFRMLMKRSRELRSDEMAAFMRPHFDSYAKLDPTNMPLLNDIRLSSAERRLIEVFKTMNLRVREVFTVSPLSKQATAAFLYAFITLGMLEFKAEESREAYLKRVSELIRRKRRRLMKSTHFDTLETHWISLPEEIRRSYHRLMSEYDPAEYNELPPEMVEDLHYIRQRLEQAYAVVSDERSRRDYRKTLIEEFMILQSAELLSKKGEMAIMRQDSKLAVDCFAKACELAPRVPEYRASLQRARSI
jgi:hypothetical protein